MIRGSDPEWRAQLAALTASPQDVVRNSAVEALGKSKDPAQLTPLVQALAHPSWTTRLAAARGLEELRVPAGVGALCAQIGKEEGRMVTELADILWKLTAQPFRTDGKQWQRWWEKESANFVFPTTEEFQKRQRELAKGVVLNGRLVCPGHQWAFELGSGWEATKGECQPTYAVRIDADRVLLDLSSRALRGPTPSPSP